MYIETHTQQHKMDDTKKHTDSQGEPILISIIYDLLSGFHCCCLCILSGMTLLDSYDKNPDKTDQCIWVCAHVVIKLILYG